ncbi:TIGR01620 family protein [Vineibacter terrae]|uniref:TIGR01620 family protein n=1 Tax=Vineibacter terrae TaxID=2586908 RepID=UPI002E2FB316|nr:TIGR01620 family protein [Vineibacter terrae]HEX2891759.1 TIGR01620 family protein [Vineibacter terrae]
MSSPTRIVAEPGQVDPAVVVPAEPAAAPPPVAIMPGEVNAAIEPIDSDADSAPPARPPASRWGWVFGLLVLVVAAFGIYGLADSLIGLWQRDNIGGAVLGLLSLAFLAALAVATAGELRALRRLRDAARFRAAIEAAQRQDSPSALAAAMAPVLAMVAERRPELARALHHRIDGQSDVAAMVRQFNAAVLAPLDQEARRAVRREALATLGAVAVSPHPTLDVAIVVWRSVAMVRRIAEIYGLRPSGLASLRLARMAVVSAATAMVADPAGEMLADALGGGLIDKVAGKAAEGSVSGLRLARLGLRAIEICRPLPFAPEERKGLLRTLLEG